MKKNSLLLFKNEDDEVENIARNLNCPVTQECMTNPVITSEGRNYERQALTQWFEDPNSDLPNGFGKKSPLDNLRLKPYTDQHYTSQYFLEDRTLRLLISDYEQSKQPFFPIEFYCPIGQELLRNPVVALDGYTYEADNITLWQATCGTSPITNQRIGKVFIDNLDLKNFISESLALAGIKREEEEIEHNEIMSKDLCIKKILPLKESISFSILQAREDFSENYRCKIYHAAEDLIELDKCYGQMTAYQDMLKTIDFKLLIRLASLRPFIYSVYRTLEIPREELFKLSPALLVALLKLPTSSSKLLETLNVYHVPLKKFQGDWKFLQDIFLDPVLSREVFTFKNHFDVLSTLDNRSLTKCLQHPDGLKSLIDADWPLIELNKIKNESCLDDILTNTSAFLELSKKYFYSVQEISSWDSNYRRAVLSNLPKYMELRKSGVLSDKQQMSADELLSLFELPAQQIAEFLKSHTLETLLNLNPDCRRKLLPYAFSIGTLSLYGIDLQNILDLPEPVEQSLLKKANLMHKFYLIKHRLFPNAEFEVSRISEFFDLRTVTRCLEVLLLPEMESLLLSDLAVDYISENIEKFKILLNTQTKHWPSVLEVAFNEKTRIFSEKQRVVSEILKTYSPSICSLWKEGCHSGRNRAVMEAIHRCQNLEELHAILQNQKAIFSGSVSQEKLSRHVLSQRWSLFSNIKNKPKRNTIGLYLRKINDCLDKLDDAAPMIYAP